MFKLRKLSNWHGCNAELYLNNQRSSSVFDWHNSGICALSLIVCFVLFIIRSDYKIAAVLCLVCDADKSPNTVKFIFAESLNLQCTGHDGLKESCLSYYECLRLHWAWQLATEYSGPELSCLLRLENTTAACLHTEDLSRGTSHWTIDELLQSWPWVTFTWHDSTHSYVQNRNYIRRKSLDPCANLTNTSATKMWKYYISINVTQYTHDKSWSHWIKLAETLYRPT